MQSKRPARLSGVTYVGFGAYFLTICVASRRPAFSVESCARDVIAELLRTAIDYAFAVIAYCVMLDHVHVLWEPSIKGDNEEGKPVLRGCAVWSTDSTDKLAFLDNMLTFFIVEVDENGNFFGRRVGA